MTGGTAPGAGEPTSGTERWQGREIAYDLLGASETDIRFDTGARECRITVTTDGVTRKITLQEEDIDVDGERLDVGRYDDVSLRVSKDFLILKLVTTRSWSSSASGSSTTETMSGASSTRKSRANESKSSGQSTDYHAFGFTDLGHMKVRVELEGGRSVGCEIVTRPQTRTIRFDVDGGKNRGTVAIEPGRLDIDGVQRTVDEDARILVSATKRSSRITADGTEIWSRS